MYEGGMKKGRMPRCWLSRPDCGDPAAVRTQDLEFRRLSLYPAELQGQCRDTQIRTGDLLLPKQAR